MRLSEIQACKKTKATNLFTFQIMIFHQLIASPVEHDDILNASIYRLIKSLWFKILGCVPQFMKKIEHSFVLRLFVQPLCIY